MIIRKILRNVFRKFANYFDKYIREVERETELSFVPSLKAHGDELRVSRYCRFIHPEYISIGDFCGFGQNCRIEAIPEYNGVKFSPDVVIGNHVTFEDNCHIGCLKSIVIGDGTMIASGVFITDNFHGNITRDELSVRPALRPLFSRPVHIGKNVWIGEHVSILPGVELGDGVIVGANSTVTHSFPAGAVIAGSPAKIIKSLI